MDLYARNDKPPAFDYASALLGLAEAQRNRGDLAAARCNTRTRVRYCHEEIGREASAVCGRLARSRVGSAIGARISASRAKPARSDRDRRRDAGRKSSRSGAISGTSRRGVRRSRRLRQRRTAVSAQSGHFRSGVGRHPDHRIGTQQGGGPGEPRRSDPAINRISEQGRRANSRRRALAFEAVARRKGRILDAVHDWGQTLRDNARAEIRERFRQREAMLACEASLTVALGYRDLKPAVIGTCALPGTELDGRYERLLHELRTNWTDARGKQALEAVGVLRQSLETLEAELEPRNSPIWVRAAHLESTGYSRTSRGRRSSGRVRRISPSIRRVYRERYGSAMDGIWVPSRRSISRCGICSERRMIGALHSRAKRRAWRNRPNKPRAKRPKLYRRS